MQNINLLYFPFFKMVKGRSTQSGLHWRKTPMRSKRRFQVKRKRKAPVRVNKRFHEAIKRLHRMNPKRRNTVIAGSSNEFIRDFSNAMQKIRKQPHLVAAKHKKKLQRHKRKLRQLVNSRTPIHVKRRLITQKGGFIFSTILVPLIAAAIGAAGTVAGSAVGAAVMKK